MYSVFDYPYKNPLRNIPCFFKGIKWSAQRAVRGYCDDDVLDLDIWFLSIVPDMLRQLKEYPLLGHPGSLHNLYYEEHKDEIGMSFEELQRGVTSHHEELREKMCEECEKKWKGIIDDMIFLFTEANEDTCSRQLSPVLSAQEGEEIYQYRKECRKKAFALFCEYFDNLWV